MRFGIIKNGKDIGKKRPKYIWMPCAYCKIPRWVEVKRGKPRRDMCHACANRARSRNQIGQRSVLWKGGRLYVSDGYIAVRIFPDDPFYPMAKGTGYVLEHRLVMARALGRLLTSNERVHHKNGDKQDNRLENLELQIRGEHTLNHSKGYRDGYTKGYADGLALAKQEIKGVAVV